MGEARCAGIDTDDALQSPRLLRYIPIHYRLHGDRTACLSLRGGTVFYGLAAGSSEHQSQVAARKHWTRSFTASQGDGSHKTSTQTLTHGLGALRQISGALSFRSGLVLSARMVSGRHRPHPLVIVVN